MSWAQAAQWGMEGANKSIGAYLDFKNAYDMADTAYDQGLYKSANYVDQAKKVMEATQQQTLKSSRESSALQGEQVAGYGASGFTEEGTPLDVMANTARQYEQDILAKGYAGNVAAHQSMQRAEWERYLGEYQAEAYKRKAWTGVLWHVGKIGERIAGNMQAGNEYSW